MNKLNLIQLDKEIHLRDVAEQWKTELNTDKKVYILSPYITSLAESLLEKVKDKEKCEIYTTFEIRNFLSGSSEIRTLKNLINTGFKIYSIPELHAKIILVSETFVSIGSQNLTYNGTKNKEATIISKEKEIIQFVESKLEKWIVERKKISIERLIEVENKLGELKENYKKLEDEIEKADEFIKEQEIQREREKQAEKLSKNLLGINKSGSSVIGKIHSQPKYHSRRGFITDHYILWTFKPNKKTTNIVELFNLVGKQTRYLALIEDNHKLSWARVNEKSITLFASGITFVNEKIEINEKPYNWSVQTNFDAETISDFNIIAKIELKEISIKLELFLLFDYKTLSIHSIIPKLNASESSYQNKELKKIVDWIKQTSFNFMEIILEKILSPFNYNEKLIGNYADKFLNVNQTYELRVGKIDNRRLLIFEELEEI